jgi:predicted phage-related endonuclease
MSDNILRFGNKRSQAREASIKRGQLISIQREIEYHRNRAATYRQVGAESNVSADKFIANGFAKEEEKKADILQKSYDELLNSK